MRDLRPLAVLLLLAAGSAAGPAAAQMGGFVAGSTVGLPATGVPARVPPNPFASNYPSAPPPAPALVERRRACHACRTCCARERVVRRAPDGARLPPGRIPR
ncbi:hypothetical protein [Methylobacterium planeticum]|uniref:Uncharacterized protein n=1 Tax=Methylobacterium planeticum TaxID=2615211 RepID=A0A6N6MU74_9HYPH|nr:hypothetical protein [Methylobacterium planeticum]KAB1075498.1 hypothetical protein F6X51_02080 [Methylobacterium planeticum]